MTHPQVARLERGDVNPSMDTLMRLAAGLSIKLTIDVRPAHRNALLANERALTSCAVADVRAGDAQLLVSAAA
jgi:transcriptional regulator with XRE-family HTH domain